MGTLTTTAAIPTTTDRARLKDGIHIELSPRRVRTYFGGKLIADSERVLLVYESRRPPAYWFPIRDIHMEHLEQKAEVEPGLTRWRIRVGDRVAENGARAYTNPMGDLEALEGHLTFYWNEMDAWFEEDQEVFVHPRDPYTRIDTVNSSKHVEIKVDGVTLADTRRPVLLYETGLPTRYYIPKQDVRMDLLEPTETHTRCPYKGVASYWSLRLGDKLVKDVVWSYPTPIQECTRIENMLSFYPDKVELYVDGVRTA
ncbi:MAG TPA: DUF427 domain-containing protein [Candidatus Dormibacteraeota bacterium]|jgi:uncharacterized protein (DUF427 family)|nr:DUF427 domain-containing protein [Candidatus Dormibacteraeota bacterium]HEX2680741.1 DUF427 domain-containing protein [Candidatus Dormibacteraeota bacterium]